MPFVDRPPEPLSESTKTQFRDRLNAVLAEHRSLEMYPFTDTNPVITILKPKSSEDLMRVDLTKAGYEGSLAHKMLIIDGNDFVFTEETRTGFMPDATLEERVRRLRETDEFSWTAGFREREPYQHEIDEFLYYLGREDSDAPLDDFEIVRR